MKRKKQIYILILSWILVVGGATFLVFKYIETKTDRLQRELTDNIMALFEGQDPHNLDYNVLNCGFFDDVFSGSQVKHYKKIPIPKYSRGLNKQLDEKHFEDWKESYADLSSLYLLNWGDKYPNNEDQGWCLVRLYCPGFHDGEFIITQSYIFPYEVGLIGGGYASIQDAVNGAYDFYTADSKSTFSDRYKRGIVQELWSKICDYVIENEYFFMKEKNTSTHYLKKGIPGAGPSNFGITSPTFFENGYMYNGFYRVFIASSQETIFIIKKDKDAIINNRNNLLLWWLLCLTIAFWTIILPLIISLKKQNKKNNETLKERLCRLCNPKEFVSNYDKERLESANDIYKSLINVEEDNKEELCLLANRAIEELGISIIEYRELEEMKEKANPSNYMNPYNPDKVTLANEAYSLLHNEKISYEDYIRIKDIIKQLKE